MRHRLHHTRVDELESIDTRTAREVQDGPRTDEESYHQEKGVLDGCGRRRGRDARPRAVAAEDPGKVGVVEGDRPASSAGDGSRRAVEAWPRRPAWEVDREGGVPDQHSDTPRAGAVGPWSHPAPSPCHGGNKPTDDEARGTTLAWRCTRVARSARIYSRCRCG